MYRILYEKRERIKKKGREREKVLNNIDNIVSNVGLFYTAAAAWVTLMWVEDNWILHVHILVVRFKNSLVRRLLRGP